MKPEQEVTRRVKQFRVFCEKVQIRRINAKPRPSDLKKASSLGHLDEANPVSSALCRIAFGTVSEAIDFNVK